jgi:hypothetical protein
MRFLVIAGALLSMGKAAPGGECPSGRLHAWGQPIGTTSTVLLYAEPGGPWRIAGEAGLVGDGSGRYDIPLLERPVLGLRYAIVDTGAVTGGGPLRLRREAAMWAGLPVDIGEPGRGLAVEGGPPARLPGMLEPAAPAWRTPLLASGAAGLLVLAALMLRRRRGPHAVAVP